jgi:hypothetical protein
VLGDTGCRIKGKELQDCANPKDWPFPKIAARAAKLKPDLVIHVGDFLYRENACPAGFAGCAGTPYGDNWPTWDVDFFTPAKPLLAAAPWVFVRGNHEDCARAGAGWLRLLGPLPFAAGAPCTAHLAPYSVPTGAVNLVVMDNADAPDTSVASDLVPIFRSEIASLATAEAPSWLLLHRPIWGALTGPFGHSVAGGTHAGRTHPHFRSDEFRRQESRAATAHCRLRRRSAGPHTVDPERHRLPGQIRRRREGRAVAAWLRLPTDD